MLRQPLCQKSRQPCDRVCVHPDCTAPAFICNTPDGCELVHKHQPQPQFVGWALLEQLNTDIFKRTDEVIKSNIADVQEKVEVIIGEMRQTLSRYVERLNDIRAGLRLKQNIGEVRDLLHAGEFARLNGKDMAVYYASLKDGAQFENKQQLLVAISQLNEKGYRLIQSVRRRINDYLHRDAEEPRANE